MPSPLASSGPFVFHNHAFSYADTEGGPSTLSGVKLSNGVTIHNSGKSTIQELTAVVEEFPQIWKDSGFAELSEENWMRILLKTGWEDKLKGKLKYTRSEPEIKSLLTRLLTSCINWAECHGQLTSTPFSYPCFVVWKNQPNGERKRRALIDKQHHNP